MSPRRSRFLVALIVGLFAALVASGCSDSDTLGEALETVDTVEPLDGSTAREPLGSAAADSSGEPVPVAFASQVADQTEKADSYRYAIDMWMMMSDGAEAMNIESDEPFATGSVAGDRFTMFMDMGAMFDGMTGMGAGGIPAELGGADLTIEAVADSDTTFMRAPYLASIATLDPSGGAGLGPFAELGDGWGRIDNNAIADFDLASSLSDMGGIQTSHPAEAAAMLRSLVGDTHEAGRTTVRDIDVTRYSGSIGLGDLIASQGMPTEDLAGFGMDAMVEEMGKIEMPVDFYVDDDDQLRRLSYEMDFSELLGGFGGDLTMSMGMAFDFFDYGADDIQVDLPDADDSVDLTEWLVSGSGG